MQNHLFVFLPLNHVAMFPISNRPGAVFYCIHRVNPLHFGVFLHVSSSTAGLLCFVLPGSIVSYSKA